MLCALTTLTPGVAKVKAASHATRRCRGADSSDPMAEPAWKPEELIYARAADVEEAMLVVSPRITADRLRFHLRRWEVGDGAVEIFRKPLFYRFIRALAKSRSRRSEAMLVGEGVDELMARRRRQEVIGRSSGRADRRQAQLPRERRWPWPVRDFWPLDLARPPADAAQRNVHSSCYITLCNLTS